jgi:hypothetical protein
VEVLSRCGNTGPARQYPNVFHPRERDETRLTDHNIEN